MDLLSGDDASGLGWYSPVYGQVEPSTTIRVTHEGAAPFWVFSVFDLDSENRVTGVEQRPVHDRSGNTRPRGGTRDLTGGVGRLPPAGGAIPANRAAAPRAGCRARDRRADALRPHDAAIARRRGVALVDGSMAGSVGPNGFELVLQNEASDFCIDVAADSPLTARRDGVRVFMDDQERPVPIHGRPDRRH